MRYLPFAFALLLTTGTSLGFGQVAGVAKPHLSNYCDAHTSDTCCEDKEVLTQPACTYARDLVSGPSYPPPFTAGIPRPTVLDSIRKDTDGRAATSSRSNSSGM
jgi:hypothetical protein